MKYLSTFSGIGGFELGINKAYEQLQNNEHAPICSESEQEECTQRGEWTTDKRQVLLHDRDRTTPLCNADGSEERGSKEDTERNKGQGLLSTQGESINTKERPVSERITDGADQRPLCVGYSEINK